jgi:type VII secretion integral membrane protein EccD
VVSVTVPGGLSLARVTVAAPKRRMDVALPDTMVVAELLPHLLRHAGDELTGTGDEHGGWVLRRASGAMLDPTRNLTAQGVRDGELLHLSPRRDDWPELAYDDVVEVIASGARRAGRSWGRAATRRCALAVGSAVLALGIVVVVMSGPPWTGPGATALAIAAGLSLLGILLSRAFADAGAGAVLAAAALPYGFTGGVLIAAREGSSVTDLGAAGLLLGSAALLVFSVIGYTGVAAGHLVFMAGALSALTGLLSAVLGLAGMASAGVAAVALTTVIGLLPGYPVIATWMGRLPVPELPDRPEDILADRPTPRRLEVFAAVSRATDLLSGMLLGAAATGGVAIAYLMATDASTPAALLAFAASLALLLRARLFALPRQRLPLLTSGVIGLALVLLGAVATAPRGAGRLMLLVILLVAAAAILTAGLVYSRRSPSPYIGRAADILDVLAIMALIPLACAVTGLYRAIQSLLASIGA